MTVRGQDRKPSPGKPSSSRDGNRKPGRWQGGKKDDKDKGEDDKGPPKPNRSASAGGGKKDPDESDPEESNPEPEPSIHDEEEAEVGQGNRGGVRGPRSREADEVKFLSFPFGLTMESLARPRHPDRHFGRGSPRRRRVPRDPKVCN